MSDFLLELRCEEIPARMQAGARETLEKLLRKELDAAGLPLGELTVWSTPRRLALIARDLPQATAAVSEELKGPRVGALGHSAGGYTVLALAGARPDPARFDAHCATDRASDPIFCSTGVLDTTRAVSCARPSTGTARMAPRKVSDMYAP